MGLSLCLAWVCLGWGGLQQMSRQYLKQLKQRAQRLLDESSQQQDEEEINAYTATQGTRSPPRIVLEDVPASDHDLSGLYDHETTDIQLLKRCITLTNENNNLRAIVDKLSAQVDSLKLELRATLEKEAALKRKVQSRDISADRREDLAKFEQAMQIIEIQKNQLQRERTALRLKTEELNREQSLMKQQWQQLEAIQKQSDIRQSKVRQISVHNDYTIKTTKREDYDRLRTRFQQLERRAGRLESVIRQQHNKSTRLCKFINKEIPALNAIIVQLTAKLDAKFERQILTQIDF